VVRIVPGAAPGTTVVTFDAGLDPGSLGGAVGLRTAGGGRLLARTTYDAATRTVTVTAAGVPGPLALTVGTGLHAAPEQQKEGAWLETSGW
jgi:hypothetical protein